MVLIVPLPPSECGIASSIPISLPKGAAVDKIDLALNEAWMRIGERCRADRQEALRRFGRSRRPSLAAPVRQWCVCIRASDTRIDCNNAIIHPLPGMDYGPDLATEDLVPRGAAHCVTLTGEILRLLTRPVFIPWPGVPLWNAEKLLGMTRDYVRHWMRLGSLEVSWRDSSRMHGKRCKPIPRVFTPRALDPQFPGGREPDSVWGSLWRSKCEMLPRDYQQTFVRTPRLRSWKDRTVFRGWDWRCPGRRAADGRWVICGRPCKYLFAPLPPFTLAQSLCEWTLEMPEGSGLRGAWQPGLHEPEVGKGRRSLACKHCWGVRNPSMLSHVGWNDFVSCISGGLLYGHEVERPEAEAPLVRKRAWSRHWSRKRDGPRPQEIHPSEIIDGEARIAG